MADFCVILIIYTVWRALMIDFSHIEHYRENNRIEAKKALGGLPESIWETYSAFANTLGGIILLGVEEKRDGSFHVVDLPSPEWIIADFWDIMNDPKKVSVNILKEENVTVEVIKGKQIIAIRIPRALPDEQPVYIGNDPFTGTYRRNGEGDYRCKPAEVREMVECATSAEAAGEPTQKKAVITFLTEYIFASEAELAVLLGTDSEQTQRIIDEMLGEEILRRTVEKGKIIYKLKS